MAFLHIFIALAVLNAIIGHFAFQYAWKDIRPLREAKEERDSKYPPFRRYDIKKWKKFKLYLGAITMMPFRFCVGLGIVLGLYVIFK